MLCAQHELQCPNWKREIDLRIGECEILCVSGGRFRLDGGAMFGVVPKPLWNRNTPADEANRIDLATNCIIVKSGDAIVLIDSGYGTKSSKSELEHMAADQPASLSEGLLAMGVSPQDVTHVAPSHLHFDHACGLTILENDVLVPTFPSARHIVQEAELEDGIGDKPELVGNYPTQELRALHEQGCFETSAGEKQITSHVTLKATGGHTRGHQVIEIRVGEFEAIYLGDLCPTTAHLKTFWTMAYDQFPLDVRRLKPALLDTAIKRHQMVLFDHDPNFVGAYLKYDDKNRVVVEQGFTSATFN